MTTTLNLPKRLKEEVLWVKKKQVEYCIITDERRKHALDEHSDAEKEWNKWRQLPLKASDLDYIPIVITEYDFIDRQGDIRFWQHINGHWYICCCQIHDSKLIFQTMYIKL